MSGGVEAVRATCLGDFPHGFLGRSGGVSTGDLSGLNVGSGSNDDRAAIAENKARAVAAIFAGPNSQPSIRSIRPRQ